MPAGAVYLQQPVTYSCWLRGPNDDDKPEPIFTADCDHVGYVAANLAVRWHPNGSRVLFVNQIAGNQHAIFEFDLATKEKQRVSPKTADAIVFDFAPDKEHLVCVLGHQTASPDDGIWIGTPGGKDWWHVPNSDGRSFGIERLRAMKPAWTVDGKQFAFVSYQPPAKKGEVGTHELHIVDFSARTVSK